MGEDSVAYINSGIPFSLKGRVMSSLTTWRNQESIILSDINQAQKMHAT